MLQNSATSASRVGVFKIAFAAKELGSWLTFHRERCKEGEIGKDPLGKSKKHSQGSSYR